MGLVSASLELLARGRVTHHLVLTLKAKNRMWSVPYTGFATVRRIVGDCHSWMIRNVTDPHDYAETLSAVAKAVSSFEDRREDASRNS
jgi:hypothetical protein